MLFILLSVIIIYNEIKNIFIKNHITSIEIDREFDDKMVNCFLDIDLLQTKCKDI